MASDESVPARIGREVAKGAVGGAVTGSVVGAEGAIIGAGLGGLAGGAKELVGLAVSHISSNAADRRLFEEDERLQAEAAVRALEEHRGEIESRLESLREAVGDHEARSTVVPTLQAWSRTWASADGKKQRVIMAGLVSAFDPESHEQAMTKRYFELLEALDYPELHFLCSIYRQIRPNRFSAWYGTDDIDYGTKGLYLARTLEQHDLLQLSSRSTKQFAPTWLGQEFATFLRRGGFNATAEDSSEAGR